MRTVCAKLTVLLVAAAPTSLHAQMPQIDAQQRAAVMAAASQQAKPAEFVLQHRTDLSLTERQVASLEVLAEAQRDSARVRQARTVERMRTNPENPALAAAVSWSGPVDEAAVREALCRQSSTQVEFMMGMAWDRRAVAGVLTPDQVSQLPRLQIGDMIKARRP